jgi:beta-glucosidase
MTLKSYLYLDKTLPVDLRVDDLLNQMTLVEKLAQLGGLWVTDLLDEKSQFSDQKAEAHLHNGIGHITRLAGASFLPPQESATLANEIQKYLVEKTRLGIPAIVHEETCAGYLAKGATTYPQAIGMAATWNPELIEKITENIRREMRSVGAHHALAPVLDISRDPRWGRIEETFGEDPYLVSRIGLAYIKGLQGDDPTTGIAATGKHFLGYGWSEGGLNWAPAHIPARELREIFLWPFLAAIHEGHIASIMNAYQELDGIPLGSSRELMVELLRDELGFDGVVLSDYFTLATFVEYHHIARDKTEAARYGLEAGIDVELPAHDVYGEPLQQAIERGDIALSLIDTSVRRLLAMKFRFGLFENPYVDTAQTPRVFGTPQQKALTLKAAEESIVLLKNDGILPLPATLANIAVIGPSADSIRLLQGDYHYPSHYAAITFEGTDITEAPAPSNRRFLPDFNADGHFPPSTSVLAGIQQLVSETTRVLYEKGCDINSSDTSRISAAVDMARQAQVAIVVVGGKSGLGKDCTTGESIDRATLGLPGVQQQLVEAIHATRTPTVVVLLNGRPLSIPWIDEHVSAIVEAWLPAQEGGNAIARVLFGQVNPGGKLPVSVPRHEGQVPVYYNHKPSGGRTHWHGDYIDSPVAPLYPFGHGLSYTKFTYSDLELSSRTVAPDETITIACQLTNSGTRPGDEVIQLYIQDAQASVTRPVKELKGFKRVSLAPGETKTVKFNLAVAQLGFYNRQMKFVVEPGIIKLMLGSSSADIRLQDQFEIIGATTEVDFVFNTLVEVI